MAGNLVLDARLQAIADMVGKCGVLADIGCDHGRLCCYMLQNQLCAYAVMTDISIASLQKAKDLAERLGLRDRAAFCTGDGAAALPQTPDVAVIAGMGGALIADIVARGQEKLQNARLVLEPNIAVCELRRALMRLEYTVTDENVLRDGRRLYTILEARRGHSEYSERELLVGPILLQKRPPMLREYAAFRLRVARNAQKGAIAGGDTLAVQQQEREIEIWKEFIV